MEPDAAERLRHFRNAALEEAARHRRLADNARKRRAGQTGPASTDPAKDPFALSFESRARMYDRLATQYEQDLQEAGEPL